MFGDVKNFLQNLPGWKTKKKILVIQSDDWGAQRTSSLAALEALEKLGVEVKRCHYARLDSLEGNDDLHALFDVLQKFRDHRNAPVRFTANCLVANPDYEKIRRHEFESYYPETLEVTLGRSPRTEQVLALWRSGFAEGFFVPQLHGREHLQTERWLSALRNCDPVLQLCFEHQMYGLSGFLLKNGRGSYLAALDYEDESHGEAVALALEEAAARFEALMGYPSLSFIAPNYVWDDRVEAVLKANRVRFLQSARAQTVSAFSAAGSRFKRRWQGQRNSCGQAYIVRNVQFEPASNPSRDWVASGLRDMSMAFRARSPAVLSTHRVNFVGHLSPENRKSNLALLRRLLERALQQWPDLEFWTTEELGVAMTGERSE